MFSELGSFNPHAPLEEAVTLPASLYTQPEPFQAELETVFSNTWQLICRKEEVAEVGSFVRAKLGTEDVLVVRNQNGSIHCLSNICRHKGTEIIKEACGKVPGFTCRYHGWTYDLDGKLRRAPQFEGVKNFSPETASLPSFSVSEWGPYIFARLQSTGQSIVDLFENVNASLIDYPLDCFQFVTRTTYDLKCNWKVFVDNYLDGGYHIATVHKGLASVLKDEEYKIEVFKKSVLQSAPLQKGKKEEVNSVRAGERALYWWIYPNIMLNFYEGVYDMNLVVPTGPHSCRVLFDYFVKDPTQKDWILKSIEVAHQVQLEDQEVSESVQRGLQSRTYQHGRFSVKREAGAFLFHQLLVKDLKSH